MQPPRALTIMQANFHQLWGGQAEVVLALSRALAERGNHLVVVCPSGSELARRAQAAGLETFTQCSFRRGFRPLAVARDVRALRRLFRARQPQIYHCHGSQDHWAGALAAPSTTKIVRTRHNIYPVRNHLFNRWLFCRRTAQVITIFTSQAEFFTSTGLLAAGRLVTLHSPLPQEFVSACEVPQVLRQELHVDLHTPLVGFCASFHPDKAPLDFVAAAAAVARTHPQVHFCLAGHGPLEPEIRAQAARLGLEKRLHLLGFREDILPVMASFDLLVLSSVTREASSTVLKQAGALGKPVVATTVGGTAEIVEHGRTGLLVRPGAVDELAAGIRALLDDRTRAAALGAAAREKVIREFAIGPLAARTEAVYRRVLEAQ